MRKLKETAGAIFEAITDINNQAGNVTENKIWQAAKKYNTSPRHLRTVGGWSMNQSKSLN